ncbi:MAG: hypothetical protein QG588_2355 [Candidatus Poribacteria bacterium]|nr:hypothetical protein [Candidatus Poribacteria bacterium]
MNVPKQDQKSPQQNKGSMLARGFYELGTPQGASLFAIIILFGIIAIVLDYIGEKFNLPKSIIYTIIFILLAIVFILIIFRLSVMNKKAVEKRQEVYRQKFGGKR